MVFHPDVTQRVRIRFLDTYQYVISRYGELVPAAWRLSLDKVEHDIQRADVYVPE